VRGAKMQKDGSVLPGDIITAVDGKPVENAPLRPGV
jgi:C-terminal processing protease CtpA/Prc